MSGELPFEEEEEEQSPDCSEVQTNTKAQALVDDLPISSLLRPKKQQAAPQVAPVSNKKAFVPPKQQQSTVGASRTTKNFSAPGRNRGATTKRSMWRHDELYFPDPELCEEMLKQGSAPVRHVAIPNKFADLQQYKKVFPPSYQGHATANPNCAGVQDSNN